MRESAKLGNLDLCCVSSQECAVYTEMTFRIVQAQIFMRFKFIFCQATCGFADSFHRLYKRSVAYHLKHTVEYVFGRQITSLFQCTVSMHVCLL